MKTLFIEPGSPWENGYVESFNGKLRDGLLDREISYTLLEVKVLLERWRQHYNRIRLDSSLGYHPAAPEAIAWPTAAAADAALAGSAPRSPPGAVPLDPGFFPSTGHQESKPEANRLTLDLVP